MKLLQSMVTFETCWRWLRNAILKFFLKPSNDRLGEFVDLSVFTAALIALHLASASIRLFGDFGILRIAFHSSVAFCVFAARCALLADFFWFL